MSLLLLAAVYVPSTVIYTRAEAFSVFSTLHPATSFQPKMKDPALT